MYPKKKKKDLTHNSPMYSLMLEKALKEAKTFNNTPKNPHKWNMELFGSGLRVFSWFQGARIAFTK